MKNKTPLLSLFVIGIALSLFLSSFSTRKIVSNTPNSCLIQIKSVTPKNISDAKAAIESNNSALVMKYCASYNVFVIQYNPSVMTPETIVRTVIQTNPRMACEIKDPAGFNEDEQGCTSVVPSNTNPN